MRITFVTRKFGNVERNSHCDVLHIAPVRVANLVLDCHGVLAIKAYCGFLRQYGNCLHVRHGAGAASQRIIRTTQVDRRTMFAFPCLIQCPWTMSPQRILLGLSSDTK